MTITQLNNKAIAVTGLPEGTCNFDINNLCNFLGFDDSETGSLDGVVELPEGNWSILGFTQDLKEEQWTTIVERSYRFPDHYLFHDYTSESTRWAYLLKTAIEAGHSLLKSKGLHVTNPYDQDPNLCNMYPEWLEANELTNPLILINK